MHWMTLSCECLIHSKINEGWHQSTIFKVSHDKAVPSNNLRLTTVGRPSVSHARLKIVSWYSKSFPVQALACVWTLFLITGNQKISFFWNHIKIKEITFIMPSTVSLQSNLRRDQLKDRSMRKFTFVIKTQFWDSFYNWHQEKFSQMIYCILRRVFMVS